MPCASKYWHSVLQEVIQEQFISVSPSKIKPTRLTCVSTTVYSQGFAIDTKYIIVIWNYIPCEIYDAIISRYGIGVGVSWF